MRRQVTPQLIRLILTLASSAEMTPYLMQASPCLDITGIVRALLKSIAWKIQWFSIWEIFTSAFVDCHSNTSSSGLLSQFFTFHFDNSLWVLYSILQINMTMLQTLYIRDRQRIEIKEQFVLVSFALQIKYRVYMHALMRVYCPA